MNGFAGGAVPDDGGLALVGDAYGGYILCVYAGFGQGLFCAGELARKNLFGVMFYPAGLWVKLMKLTLGCSGDFAGVVKDDGAGAGGALVESQNAGHEGRSAFGNQ